jgi:hypothetical protein
VTKFGVIRCAKLIVLNRLADVDSKMCKLKFAIYPSYPEPMRRNWRQRMASREATLAINDSFGQFYFNINITLRQAGYALIERNWVQNALNLVTCRYDSSNCGKWTCAKIKAALCRFVLSSGNSAAACSAATANFNTLVHVANKRAVLCTGFANLCAKTANLRAKT